MKNPFDSRSGFVVASSMFLVAVLFVFLISLAIHIVTQIEHGGAILVLVLAAIAALRVTIYMFWEKD